MDASNSNSRRVTNGDDPMDEDYQLEEVGSKKKAPYQARTKRARNPTPDPSSSSSKTKDDDGEAEEGD